MIGEIGELSINSKQSGGNQGMSVSIRLSRMGSNKNAFYRIVVLPTRSKRDGSALDTLGYYRPDANPRQATLELDRAKDWIKKGAIVSSTVMRLVKMAEKSESKGETPVKIVFASEKTKKAHKDRLAAKKKG
jgi:small subunit ribosomal protein S16